MKDFVLFSLGIVVGFLFGVAIYWLPLKQFKRELSSLKNLVFKRYKRGDEILVKSGASLQSVDDYNEPPMPLYEQTEMIIAYDLGVEWFYTNSDGHIRARVVHASLKSQLGLPFLYRVPHCWIEDAE